MQTPDILTQEVEIIFSFKIGGDIKQPVSIEQIDQIKKQDYAKVELLKQKENKYEVKINFEISCNYDFDKINREFSRKIFALAFNVPVEWHPFDIAIENVREENEIYSPHSK